MKYFFLTLSLLLLTGGLFAQHESTHASGEKMEGHRHSVHHPKFRVASFISHTLIPTPHNQSHVFIPSLGIDLEYWPGGKFGIGLHNDIELETFFVEGPEEELVEREYPMVSTLDVLYKPFGGLVLVAGGGYELVKGDDFFVVRLGAEYEIEMANHWDVFLTFAYDASTGDRNYHTYTFGLGFGKRF